MKKQLNFVVNSKVSESPTKNIHIYFKQRRKNETLKKKIQYTILSKNFYNKI